MTMGEDYGKVYFLTDRMEDHLDVLDEIAAKADLEIGVGAGDGSGDRDGLDADSALERGGEEGRATATRSSGRSPSPRWRSCWPLQ